MEKTSESQAAVASKPETTLDRPGARHGLLRRVTGGFVHFLAYHFILSRRSIRTIQAAGFKLRVRPTVFHPRFFLSSEYFAEFLDGLDLAGKNVADIGTGSGILALAAARAGAKSVLALDINPDAARSAQENAQANGVGERVKAACMGMQANLAMSPIAAGTPVRTIGT